jgi:hypothetical protein
MAERVADSDLASANRVEYASGKAGTANLRNALNDFKDLAQI